VNLIDMNKAYAIAFVIFAAIFVVALVPKSPAPTPARKAVVVELFTSEGCSSCPPADALLIKLREQHSDDGVEIIPLGFHVDYWNRLGWRDRFSSAEYSQRQEDYATRMKLDGPYTPQMVVDGDTEFVGNNTGRAHDAIVQAAGRSPGAQLEVTRSSGDKLHVKVSSASTASADILLAITEDNLSSSVKSGENSGHVLRHAAVVRIFRKIGQTSAGGFDSDVALNPGKDWKRKDLRAIVFVQEKPVGKILAATETSLTGTN
jgi:hypothetical protein